MYVGRILCVGYVPQASHSDEYRNAALTTLRVRAKNTDATSGLPARHQGQEVAWKVDDLYVNEALDTVVRAIAVAVRRELWAGPGGTYMDVALDPDDFYFTCAIAKCAGPRADMATADSYGPCTVKTGEHLPREY